MQKKTKRRLIFFLLFLSGTAIEVLIALLVHDAFIRPYLGDVLAVIILYFLVRTISPDEIRYRPLSDQKNLKMAVSTLRKTQP